MISLSQFYSLNLTHRIRLGPTNVFYGVLNLNMITRLSELQFEGIAILTLNGDSVMPPSDWIFDSKKIRIGGIEMIGTS